MAGDPLQLGPVIFSGVARNLGLERSLMQRLMEDFAAYQPNVVSASQVFTLGVSMDVKYS